MIRTGNVSDFILRILANHILNVICIGLWQVVASGIRFHKRTVIDLQLSSHNYNVGSVHNVGDTVIV